METWTFVALLGLGALHGLNPGMGWLFAVALGLQEQDRRAVWRAIPPLALGHALAIGAVVAIAAMVGLVVPAPVLKWSVAMMLAVTGVWKLISTRHPRYGGMRVGARDLTIWSFLMASAHGAGIMVLPLVIGGSSPAEGPMVAMAGGGALGDHANHLGAAGGAGAVAASQLDGLLATAAHSAGYLVITALLAVIVYERLGLRMLRSAWINLDLVWAAALVVAAVATVATMVV